MTAITAVQGRKPRPSQIPSLDGIRAFSWLLVFAAHSGLERVIPAGFGVAVFFFLSGYLITTLMRVEYDESGSISLREFYLRRLFRIMPPFYLVLCLSVLAALSGLLPGELYGSAVFAQFAHFANYRIAYYPNDHGYDGMPRGTGVYWSLAVEEHFYIVFPWLYASLRRTGWSPARQAAALLGLCLAVLAWRWVLVHELHAYTNRTYVATDTRLDSLLFGCALAIYGNPALDRPSEPAGRLWKMVLLPLGLVLLLFTFVHRNEEFRQTLRYTLQGIGLIPVFVVAVREPRWGPCRLLNHPWVAFVGTLSYSLYLVHHVVLIALEHCLPLPAVVRSLLGLVLSGALAYAIYRGIELPCAKLRKRLTAHMRATAANARAPAAVGTAQP